MTARRAGGGANGNRDGVAERGGALSRAYAAIGRLTPIPADCGKLCGAACCKDSVPDGEFGMLLFPGEVERFHGAPGFRVERVGYMGARAWMLFCDCDGRCDRRLRPLACRVFPLAPRVGADGRVAALPDPRARRMCPLAGGEHLDRAFARAVTRAFRELARDAQALAFLRLQSDELDELRRLV